MSRKYEKKESGKWGLLWILIVIILMALAVAVVLPVLLDKPSTNVDMEQIESSTVIDDVQAETPETTLVTETIIPQEDYLLSIDGNIKIKEISSYTGPYMEDGTDEDVEDVLQILVKNIGDEPLQYAKVTLLSQNEEAVFEMTTLFPGESMIVLETNRKKASADTEYTAVRADNIAYFQYDPTTHTDKLSIQPLDGGFNIKNISGEDIDGKIVIYFKDYKDGQYVGGITYSGTIQDGMKADELKQIMTDNFSVDSTKIVFINIG